MKKSKINYSFTKSYNLPQRKAQEYGEYLERLVILNQGKLIPKDIVKAARSKDSPLHNYFEWDDSIAGDRYRMEQARYLLRAIEYNLDFRKQPLKIRMFLNVKINKNKKAYVPVEIIAKRKDYREQIIQQALNELVSWQEKYKIYKELDKIFGVIKEVQKELNI